MITTLVPALCLSALNPAPVSQPVSGWPAVFDGRVAFYAARYRQGQPLAELHAGAPDELHPLASLFKFPLLINIFADVDAGRLNLDELLLTTPALRSIERYPAGKNSVKTLAGLMISRSDNTAADILMQRYGTRRMTLDTWQRSPCTTVYLTSKAQWGTQAGLTGWKDVIREAARYGDLPPAARLDAAGRLNAASLKITGPAVEAGLERFFKAHPNEPQVDYQLHSTSTARAFATLMAQQGRGETLKGSRQKENRAIFEKIMSTGCCLPKKPVIDATFRGNKGGSGWRILNLAGRIDLKNGDVIAYTFLSDQNTLQDAEALERHIPALTAWIEQQMRTLTQ